MKSSLWRGVCCAPSAPPSEATFALKELKTTKNSKGEQVKLATISECRYRWLHVPATTFIITRSPSRSNRRDGGGLPGNARRAKEPIQLLASVTWSIENDRRASAFDKASRDATRVHSFS